MHLDILSLLQLSLLGLTCVLSYLEWKHGYVSTLLAVVLLRLCLIGLLAASKAMLALASLIHRLIDKLNNIIKRTLESYGRTINIF